MTKHQSILTPIKEITTEFMIVMGIMTVFIGAFQIPRSIETINNKFSKPSLESIANTTGNKKSIENNSFYNHVQQASYTIENSPIVSQYQK